MKKILAMCVFVLSSCGYQYVGQGKAMSSAPLPTFSVSYAKGDPCGDLTNELVYQLSECGALRYTQSNGDLLLKIVFLSDEHERIGFRYDRDNPSGDREKNLLGVEARRSIVVEITLEDQVSGRVLLGPYQVSSFSDYDYTDPGSPRDLLFSQQDPIIQFSLGQLDSYEGAYDDSTRPLFRSLAQKIVSGLIVKLPDVLEELSL